MSLIARLGWVALVACVFSFVRPATAADERVECIDAHAGGQNLRKEGKLAQARAQFVSCTRTQCPALIRKDCTAFLDELDGAQPTIVVEARDAAGSDVTSGSLTIDGVGAEDALRGRAVPLDPGEHRLRLESLERSAELRIVVREGTKGRRIVILLPAPPAAPARPPEERSYRPVPWTVPLLTALGGVGLGVGTGFGVAALSKNGELRGCAPRCADEGVDLMLRDARISTIAIGVGIAALASAAILFLTRPTVTRAAAQPLRGRETPYSSSLDTSVLLEIPRTRAARD